MVQLQSKPEEETSQVNWWLIKFILTIVLFCNYMQLEILYYFIFIAVFLWQYVAHFPKFPPFLAAGKGLFTCREGDPPSQKGYPSLSIVFPSLVYMRGSVALGGGLPYVLARVTLLGGPTFCLFTIPLIATRPSKSNEVGNTLPSIMGNDMTRHVQTLLCKFVSCNAIIVCDVFRCFSVC